MNILINIYVFYCYSYWISINSERHVFFFKIIHKTSFARTLVIDKYMQDWYRWAVSSSHVAIMCVLMSCVAVSSSHVAIMCVLLGLTAEGQI